MTQRNSCTVFPKLVIIIGDVPWDAHQFKRGSALIQRLPELEPEVRIPDLQLVDSTTGVSLDMVDVVSNHRQGIMWSDM